MINSIEEWLGKDNKLGKDIWENKYRHNNESFDEWLDRISGGNKELRELMVEKKFLFGGRALANRGTNKSASFSNCYSSGYCGDSIDEIMKQANILAKTYKSQGGQGVSLTKIRPKGTSISSEYESDGIVPFMEIFNTVTESISQGGSRKGALMISLDARHKEAETFISIKANDNKITKANLSLEIDDVFMQAVNKYYEYGLMVKLDEVRQYEGHIIEYEITPINIFKLLAKVSHEWAEPCCIFTEQFRNYNLMELDEDYSVETANACGEQPLPKNFSCNLGSINLYEFVDNKFTDEAEFDYDEFERAVDISIKALDDIIDENINNHPFIEQQQAVRDYRNCGLGVFGYADALVALRLIYGSTDALEFSAKLFKKMFKSSVYASNKLALSKGAFPKYKEIIFDSEIMRYHFSKEERKQMARVGLRNCSLLSIAPTGSISTFLNRSGGTEPIFALSHTRKTESLHNGKEVYYDVLNPMVASYYKAAQEPEYEMLPDYFITSRKINWMDRIETQSIIQKSIDTAISSTINLPQHIAIEEIEQLYLYAWKKRLKGLSIYREGCNRGGILTTEPEIEIKPEELKEDGNKLGRGIILNVSDDLMGAKRTITNGCGKFYLNANYDEESGDILETFIDIGGSGGCERNLQFISRLISVSLRGGIPLEEIISQAQSIRPCKAYTDRTAKKGDTSQGTSCPSAIGIALKTISNRIKNMHFIDESESICEEAEEEKSEERCVFTKQSVVNSENVCEDCGGEISHSGGCVVCIRCGWSKCN